VGRKYQQAGHAAGYREINSLVHLVQEACFRFNPSVVNFFILLIFFFQGGVIFFYLAPDPSGGVSTRRTEGGGTTQCD